jgi:hypothetical protein
MDSFIYILPEDYSHIYFRFLCGGPARQMGTLSRLYV